MSTVTSDVIRTPLMSGFCAFPQTKDPEASHARCAGGQRANPRKEFQPCPCPHHFADQERYECGNCGGVVVAAPHWPLDFSEDPDGEVRYTHLDPRTGRATGEECG